VFLSLHLGAPRNEPRSRRSPATRRRSRRSAAV